MPPSLISRQTPAGAYQCQVDSAGVSLWTIANLASGVYRMATAPDGLHVYIVGMVMSPIQLSAHTTWLPLSLPHLLPPS